MTDIVLTPEQEKVVAVREGSYLVLAPPGAGKTEVLAQRIVRLLRDSRGDNYRVLALTYNNRAAASMRNRVRDRLGEESWRATIETYHAFYLDVLRHYGQRVGVPQEATVYDTVDARIEALAQGLEDDGFVLNGEELDRAGAVQLLDRISRLTRALIPVEAAPDEQVGKINLRDAYAAYDKVLRRNGALDFDTMLSRAYELLSEYPEVARHYRRIYKFVLVDEAQDTSTIQFELLRVLCGDEHRNVFMVADPDQLINRWLGADRRNLDRFKADFEAVEFHLSTNFRCADVIVEAANRLLDVDKRKRPVSPTGNAPGWLGAYSFSDESVEAMAVLEWARGLTDEGLRTEWLSEGEPRRIAPEEVAILARSRLQLEAILYELDRSGYAYSFRVGDVGPFESELFGSLLDMLRVLANPRDVAMRRTLLARFATAVDVAEVDTDAFYRSDVSTFLQMLAEVDPGGLGDIAAELAGTNEVARAMEMLIRPTAEEESGSDLGERQRLDREVLEERWTRYRHSTESRLWSWTGVVTALLDQPRDEGSGLRVSTVHGAKGLEFRAVALVGMNEGSFPDFRSTGTADEEASERRLAYVAVTRAARALLLTRPRERITRYGSRRVQSESRFIREMDLSMTAQ